MAVTDNITEPKPNATAPSQCDAEHALQDLDGIADLLRNLARIDDSPDISSRTLYFLGSSIAELAETIGAFVFPKIAADAGEARP